MQHDDVGFFYYIASQDLAILSFFSLKVQKKKNLFLSYKLISTEEGEGDEDWTNMIFFESLLKCMPWSWRRF